MINWGKIFQVFERLNNVRLKTRNQLTTGCLPSESNVSTQYWLTWVPGSSPWGIWFKLEQTALSLPLFQMHSQVEGHSWDTWAPVSTSRITNPNCDVHVHLTHICLVQLTTKSLEEPMLPQNRTLFSFPTLAQVTVLVQSLWAVNDNLVGTVATEFTWSSSGWIIWPQAEESTDDKGTWTPSAEQDECFTGSLSPSSILTDGQKSGFHIQPWLVRPPLIGSPQWVLLVNVLS